MFERIKTEVLAILGALLLLLAPAAQSFAVPISAFGIYSIIGDVFTIRYFTGAAGLNIVEAAIDVSTCNADSDGCVFDPPFATVAGLLLGTPEKISPAENGVAQDATSISFLFSDFNVGEIYVWSLDVDEDPGGNGISGSDLAGSIFSLMLAGPGYVTTTLTGTYVAGHHSCGFVSFLAGCVTVSGEVPEAVPEPIATFLLGMAFLAFGFTMWRKKST